MKFGEIDVAFVCHTTFLFSTKEGRVLLTDPYFSGGFQWQGQQEKHLQRPDMRPETIDKCDVIFVSHDHGDHFDPHAIRVILENNDAIVLAPPEIMEQLEAMGLDNGRFWVATENTKLKIGDLRLTAMGGYDDAYDEHGRMNKFSILIESRATTLWYSGDCHRLPPGLSGKSLDAVFSWTIPHTVEHMRELNPLPKRFIVTHCDQHTPGHFWCNRDPWEEARFVSEVLPEVKVFVPHRQSEFSLVRNSKK